MRVVITGGRGFIGSHLCAALIEAGHEPIALDDLSGSYSPALVRPPCRVVLAHAEDAAAGGLLDEADAVIHLAALPGVRARIPAERLAARNVALAGRLARESCARGLRFVLASTSSVYGNPPLLPTPEAAPPAPLNEYARSKAAAEAACPHAVRARLFTVYGPGQRPDMAFARWIESLASGAPLTWCAPEGAERDFTFVEDAARGLVAALEHGRSGEAYNIGGGRSVPVREALEALEDLVGREARLDRVDYGVSEARATAACGRKAAVELGYEPRVALLEGLRRQVEAALPAAVSVSPPAVAA